MYVSIIKWLRRDHESYNRLKIGPYQKKVEKRVPWILKTLIRRISFSIMKIKKLRAAEGH